VLALFASRANTIVPATGASTIVDAISAIMIERAASAASSSYARAERLPPSTSKPSPA
jgi:hypothetical protein